jgi:hypothetical protein
MRMVELRTPFWIMIKRISPRNQKTRRRPMDRNDARDDEIREEESFEALLNESAAEPAGWSPDRR